MHTYIIVEPTLNYFNFHILNAQLPKHILYYPWNDAPGIVYNYNDQKTIVNV